jgi:hypothetical protein
VGAPELGSGQLVPAGTPVREIEYHTLLCQTKVRSCRKKFGLHKENVQDVERLSIFEPSLMT